MQYLNTSTLEMQPMNCKRMWIRKENLDILLVPAGLIIMFGYHLFLLYRILTAPHTTVIGYENHNKMAWVERMMLADPNNMGLALQVISSNESAATFLASISITLSSLIGTWFGSSSNNLLINKLIYGDTSPPTTSLKYITLLAFFLIAFASFVQSARYFVHANFLISTPNTDMPVKYVQLAVIRGSNFSLLGLRALYFATTLLLWIFGPIPMVVSSVAMVIILNFLDNNSIPLHPYRVPMGQNLVKRISEEGIAADRATVHHGG
ncbi:uncharacterized protein LOC122640574 [Telopea speciosissima]|uniref:uncharacterized protein LOC122640574 n=1 Tax=Telopea speciosissima TaxID=54955 RepID=UPI001CC71C7A|nr:uncharacterized protein LOC122640574 [Telopea speciosissima]